MEKDDALTDLAIESRAKDFIELHEQVESSLALLSSLESFLGTFQNDLSAVSGHISDLQARSKDFDSRLRSRRKVAQPLGELITTITIPPQLATTILDTPISDAWIPAIKQLEALIESISAHANASRATSDAVNLKAAKDLEGVVEGVRIAAATKIRTHFLSLLEPLRTSITTNIQVLQGSIFIKKYLPLYRFLQRRASSTADEFRVAYVRCAKLYYETGIRRYTRSLGYVRARVNETSTPIGSLSTGSAESEIGVKFDENRLSNGKIDGPAVILAYQADDKTFTAHTEAIFRSALLVLLDNASAEFAFLREFFKAETFSTATTSLHRRGISIDSTDSFNNGRLGSDIDELRSPGAETESMTLPGKARANGVKTRIEVKTDTASLEEKKMLEGIWKQIFDPVLPYVQTLISSFLSPSPPPLIPLLTMIRATDAVLDEASKRGCAPLEPFLLNLRMQLWPLFQKGMSDNVESLKKLADSGGGNTGAFAGFGASMFGGGKQSVNEGVVQMVSGRYATLFSSVIALSAEEESMLFVNLQRMRNELNRLIAAYSQRIKDPSQSAAFTSQMCDGLLKMLSSRERLSIHPKAQAEVAFWREREEEARRRIASARRTSTQRGAATQGSSRRV